MKYLFTVCLLLSIKAFAQTPSRSAFEIQREKVNLLLSERSAKFGQYDASLHTRTGIFGLQTKRDIRNSNEILRQIALTDNAIFRELKVLLDYKDLQTKQVATDASANQAKVTAYRETIKKLQDQNAQLRTQNELLESKFGSKNLLITLLMCSICAMGYIFYKRYKKRNLLSEMINNQSS